MTNVLLSSHSEADGRLGALGLGASSQILGMDAAWDPRYHT